MKLFDAITIARKALAERGDVRGPIEDHGMVGGEVAEAYNTLAEFHGRSRDF